MNTFFAAERNLSGSGLEGLPDLQTSWDNALQKVDVLK